MDDAPATATGSGPGGFASLGPVDALLDQLPDGVVVCSRDGTIAVANQTFALISGYGAAELIGRPIDGLVPAQHRARHAGLRVDFVAEHTTRPMGPGLHLQLERRDHTLVPVEISLAPIGDPAAGVVV